jgi:hypothetical protein
VQVAGYGNIFGHYSAVAWPRPINGPNMTAEDPSEKSFLFAVKNAFGRPARFKLSPEHARAGAVSMNDVSMPCFGARPHTNLALFRAGGVWCEDFGASAQRSYQFDANFSGNGLDAWPANQRFKAGFFSQPWAQYGAAHAQEEGEEDLVLVHSFQVAEVEVYCTVPA